MFGRQAYVGLSDDRFGTVTLGRQYDSVVDYLAQTTANGNWAGYLFAHPYDNDNTDNSFRVDNSVKYASPDFAGFQFGGTYSFSNDTNFANNRAVQLRRQYANGGLLVAAAYLQANNPGVGSNGAITANDASFIAGRMRVFGGGINYTFGSATVGFAYTNSNYKNPTGNGYIGIPLAATGVLLNTLKYQNFEVNGKYQITPAFFVGAQYVYTMETLRRLDRQRETENPLGRTDGGLQPVQTHGRLRSGRISEGRRRFDQLDSRRRIRPRHAVSVVNAESGRGTRSTSPQVLKGASPRANSITQAQHGMRGFPCIPLSIQST